MSSSPLPKQHLGILLLLLLVGIGTVALGIMRYNRIFFVSQQPVATQETQTIGTIPIIAADPILGNKAAPITVIGFEDFLCDTCRRQHGYISELLVQYPDTFKFIWKDFSIVNLPEQSELVHIFGYCMNAQDLFEPYADQVFASYLDVSSSALQSMTETLGADMNALESCVNSLLPSEHLDKVKLLASALNIQQAPTFFVNGKQIQTPQSLTEWRAVLQLRN
jgi:protein-disulfide isomerase